LAARHYSRQPLCEWAVDLTRDGDRFLEVGAGSGAFRDWLLTKRAVQYVGVDYSGDSSEVGHAVDGRWIRASGIIEADWMTWTVPPADVTFSCEVIQHLSDPWEGFRKLINAADRVMICDLKIVSGFDTITAERRIGNSFFPMHVMGFSRVMRTLEARPIRAIRCRTKPWIRYSGNTLPANLFVDGAVCGLEMAVTWATTASAR
jgi:hypothetical protein